MSRTKVTDSNNTWHLTPLRWEKSLFFHFGDICFIINKFTIDIETVSLSWKSMISMDNLSYKFVTVR